MRSTAQWRNIANPFNSASHLYLRISHGKDANINNIYVILRMGVMNEGGYLCPIFKEGDINGFN